jgi:hypothetical protein
MIFKLPIKLLCLLSSIEETEFRDSWCETTTNEATVGMMVGVIGTYSRIHSIFTI